MAAQKHESKLIVRYHVKVADVTERAVVVVWGRGLVGFVEMACGDVALGAGGFASEPVDGTVAGCGRDPSAWVGWDPGFRPALRSDRERVGDGVLGEVDITEDTDHRRDTTPDFAAVHISDRAGVSGHVDEPRSIRSPSVTSALERSYFDWVHPGH